MKIYVCSGGCIYEGGGHFHCTIDYVDAWKAARRYRLERFNEWSNNTAGHKYLKKKDFAFENLVHDKKEPNMWAGSMNYVKISSYEVPEELVLKYFKGLHNDI